MKYLIPVLVLLLIGQSVTAEEYSLPFKIGGETLSVDTDSFDPVMLAALGGGGYGIWSWLRKRKADPGADAVSKLPANMQQLIQALMNLWNKLPSGKKPVSLDVTINFESGEPYTFHINLGGKKPTPPPVKE